MDKQEVRDARVAIEEERKRIEQLIANGNADLGSQESLQLLAQLLSELILQEDLIHCLEESQLRVEKIQLPTTGISSGDVTSGLKVANNSMVIGRLVQFLGKDDLLNCRLISPLFNQEIVRLVTHAVDSTPFDLLLGDSFSYANLCPSRDFNALAKAGGDDGERTLRDFHLLLENSSHPEFLMKVLTISHAEYSFEICPINLLESEQILAKFGHHVDKIIICDNEWFGILIRCLGQNGYCPNLQHLIFRTHQDCHDELPVFEEPFVGYMGSLKLKSLLFIYSQESLCKPESIDAVLKVFNGLLNNSPDIYDISIHCRESATPPDDWKTDRFIQVLHSKPQVMQRLKKFHLDGNLLANFTALFQLQFGSNLATIGFNEVKSLTGQLSSTTKDMEKSFGKFLKMISNSLEDFTLGLRWNCLSQLPVMPKLKTLHCNGLLPSCALQSLKNFPSLRKFKLEEYTSLEELLEGCWEKEDKSEESLSGIPHVIHLKLEYIATKDDDICKPETIGNLNVAFPNLSRLRISPELPTGCSLEEYQSWFEQSFHFISQMNHLTNLEIRFRGWNYEKLSVDLKEAFSNLKNTPNLAKLKLMGLDYNEFNASLIATSLPVLCGAPKLRRIILECSPVKSVGDENLKEMITQMITNFAENGIRLEIQ